MVIFRKFDSLRQQPFVKEVDAISLSSVEIKIPGKPKDL